MDDATIDRHHSERHLPARAGVGVRPARSGIVTVLQHRLAAPVTDDRGATGLRQLFCVAGAFGSRGRPRTRSPTMLRWIWLVPPQIVSERLKKKADIIPLTG